MKNILLTVVFIILLYLLFRPTKDYEPSQDEIQSDSYVDKTKSVEDFPYPQLSRSFKQLTKGKLPKPLNNLTSLLPKPTDLELIRSSSSDKLKQRMYLPDYYRKDRLSGNPSGSEEYSPFLTNGEPDNSWSDINVSEHPKFYNAEIKDDITNIGSFFDKNNNYADKTSYNSDTLTTDTCYEDKKGVVFCNDNTRIQLVPPKLITNPNSSIPLNTIGPYKKPIALNDKDDRIINGGIFFDNIKGSQDTNEFFSSFNTKPIEVSLNY